jgi:hypothetical protein
MPKEGEVPRDTNKFYKFYKDIREFICLDIKDLVSELLVNLTCGRNTELP